MNTSSDLYHLYFVDHKARRSAYVVLAAIVFAYGVICNVVLKRPTAQVATEATLLGIIASLLWPVYYCRRRRMRDRGTASELSLNARPARYLPAYSFIILLGLTPLFLSTIGQSLLTFNPTFSAKIWGGIEALSTYRSFLTSRPQLGWQPVTLSIAKRGPSEEASLSYVGDRFMVRCVNCGQLNIKSSGRAASEHAASADQINEKEPNQPGPEFYLVSGSPGATIVLDGWRFKHVSFENVKISYAGGPLSLDNAYFVKCTFSITNNESGKKLTGLLLKPGPVNFQR